MASAESSNSNSNSNIISTSNTAIVASDNAALNEFWDNLDNTVARINFWFMLFGIFGNTMCIFVFMRKPLLNRKFNWYLIILAIVELFFCSIVWANYLILNLTEHHKFIYDLNVFTCLLTDYIVNSTDAFCVFLTLILSVDRLYAITNPIKSRSFVTYRFPKRIAALTFLLLLVIKSPEVFLTQRRYIYTIGTPNHTAPSAVSLSSFIHSPSSTPIYHYVEDTAPAMESTSSSSSSDSQSASSMSNSKSSNMLVKFLNNFKNMFIETEYSVEQTYDSQRCTSNNLLGEDGTVDNQDASSTLRKAYIIYCNIFIPLFLNIVPAISILLLNLMLWFFIRRYNRKINNTKRIKNTDHVRGERKINCQPNSSTTAFASLVSVRRPLTITQKSHYFTIIILGIWLLVTSVPFYTLNTYYWITTLRFIENKSRWPLAIQAISSAFFNSNHCINILIYLIFHKDFRTESLKILISLFNINPFFKLNVQFLDSMRKKGNGGNGGGSFNGNMPSMSFASAHQHYLANGNITSSAGGCGKENGNNNNTKRYSSQALSNSSNLINRPYYARNLLDQDCCKKSSNDDTSLSEMMAINSTLLNNKRSSNNKPKFLIRKDNTFLERLFKKKKNSASASTSAAAASNRRRMPLKNDSNESLALKGSSNTSRNDSGVVKMNLILKKKNSPPSCAFNINAAATTNKEDESMLNMSINNTAIDAADEAKNGGHYNNRLKNSNSKLQFESFYDSCDTDANLTASAAAAAAAITATHTAVYRNSSMSYNDFLNDDSASASASTSASTSAAVAILHTTTTSSRSSTNSKSKQLQQYPNHQTMLNSLNRYSDTNTNTNTSSSDNNNSLSAMNLNKQSSLSSSIPSLKEMNNNINNDGDADDGHQHHHMVVEFDYSATPATNAAKKTASSAAAAMSAPNSSYLQEQTATNNNNNNSIIKMI